MIRLGLRVAPDDAEAALARLIELAPNGVEQVDGDGFVEYALYGADGDLPSADKLTELLAGIAFEAVTSDVADDWAERWRAFHQPLDVGPLHVRPPWEPEPGAGRIDVVIDPGQAFGTGAHDTTRLCLELLSEIEPQGAFADLGCGSGVLAIAAARLGFKPIVAVDHDLESIRATADNARANGVSVDAERFDLLRGGPAPSAPTVAANILRPILLAVARAGFAGATPRRLIVSGLLPGEVDEVAAAFERHGLREARRLSTSDWAAALLVI